MPEPAHATTATECVTFACDFSAGRDATRRLSRFLAANGVPESELFACELALTEACNNAVQHARERGRRLPVTACAVCSDTHIELRVVDHTEGFDWPAAPAPLPPPDAEHGRGLFIIRSMMDGAGYHRGDGENTLTMWKARGNGSTAR